MSQAILRPYPFIADLELACQLVGVDAQTTASGELLLTEDVAPTGSLEIRANLAVTPGSFDQLVPASERDDPPVTVAVAVRSVPSRLRRIVRCNESAGAPEYQTTIILAGNEIFQELELQPVVFRNTEGDPDSGFAAHRGARLAEGRPLKVFLQEPPAPPGAQLEIRYEDFANSTDSLRRGNHEVLFALELGGDEPVLYLNSGVEYLVPVTQSRGRRGVQRRIRDATFDTIVCQAWTSMISASATALASAASADISRPDVVDLLPNWQRRVLYSWAPRLFPETSDREQALDDLFNSIQDIERGSELQERVCVAVQQVARSNEAFAGLVTIRTGEGV